MPPEPMTPEQLTQLLTQHREHDFYVSPAWRHLRAEVLAEDHYECQECKRRGQYSRASHVHHVLHLRAHPALALSKTYLDGGGKVQRNLLSVCRQCHETVCHPERLRKSKPAPWPESWD